MRAIVLGATRAKKLALIWIRLELERATRGSGDERTSMLNEPIEVGMNGQEKERGRLGERVGNWRRNVMDDGANSSRLLEEMKKMYKGIGGAGRGKRRRQGTTSRELATEKLHRQFNAGEGKRKTGQDEKQAKQTERKEEWVPLDRNSRFDKTFALDNFNGMRWGRNGVLVRGAWWGGFLRWRHFYRYVGGLCTASWAVQRTSRMECCSRYFVTSRICQPKVR